MSGVRPWQGCAHAGRMSFDVYVCRCSACGAEWHRSSDGPWRCVDPGGDRECRLTCSACGAETGAGASSCGLCGRPLFTVASTTPTADEQGRKLAALLGVPFESGGELRG